MTSTYFHASVRGPVERSAKRSVLINLMDERSLKRFFFREFQDAKCMDVCVTYGKSRRRETEAIARGHHFGASHN